MSRRRFFSNRSRRWLALLATILGAAGIVSGLGSPNAAASAATTNFELDVSANHEAALVGDAIYGLLRGSPDFANVYIASAGLIIGLTKDDTALESTVEAAAASVDDSVPILFSPGQQFSNSELLATVDGVLSAKAQLASEGVDLAWWGVDQEEDRVDVALTTYSDDAAATLVAQFGPILSVSTAATTSSGDSGRSDDSEPWWGGDNIQHQTSTGYLSCTAWFSVKDVTANYGTMLTAGHCKLGKWYNGSNNNHWGNSAYYRGDVQSSYQHWQNNGVEDAERTGNTGTQQTYVWSNPSSGDRNVHSVSHNPIAGTEVCIDGAVTRETCGAYIRY